MKNCFLVLVILSVGMLFSCSDNGNAVKNKPAQNNELVSTPLVENTEQQPNEEIQEVVEIPIDPSKTEISYYNGLPCTPEVKQSRPVAVMINNLKISHPQEAVSDADIVYECDTEGGTTRLMCIFQEWQMLDEIGSVRSARDYFVSISQGHDALFVHAGGSPTAYEKIINNSLENIDGVNMGGLSDKTFYRDSQRISKNGYEHSMMTTGTKLYTAINDMKYRKNHNSDFYSPYEFNSDFTELTDAKSVEEVSLEHSSYITVEFSYDADSKKFYKSSYNEPHIDASNNKQLAFENLIIIFVDEEVVDDAGRLEIDLLSGGEGYYMTAGGYIDITWSRSSEFAPFEFRRNGELIKLNPGKTHISLFNSHHREKVKVMEAKNA